MGTGSPWRLLQVQGQAGDRLGAGKQALLRLLLAGGSSLQGVQLAIRGSLAHLKPEAHVGLTYNS